MIPHQLQIKNFLSYGPETQIIDFSNYHLICLSGKNGHGKSAMLDAITWAIWGQARKSSGNNKPDAGLLHLGQKHMMVILEFEVNGQHYRVRREYLNTATKPFATLDFGIKNSDGKLSALTDKTIKDTQEKIERTIGITYESFTNSTFLRQGQSNEFSKKLPKERKEILAQILQLSKFEDQKKIAQLHARKLQIDWSTQSNIADRIDQELIALESVTQQQTTITQNLQDLENQRQELHNQKTDLIAQAQKLQQKKNEQTFLLHQKENVEKNINTLREEIEKLQSTLKLQAPEIDVEKLKTEEQELVQKVQNLQILHQEKLQLKELYLTTKEKLNELTIKLQKQHQEQEQLLKINAAQLQEALNHQHKQLTLEQNLHEKFNVDTLQLQKQLDYFILTLQPLLNIKQEHEQAQEIFEKNKIIYQNLCAQGIQLKQQLTLTIEKQTHKNKECSNVCDECQQPLSLNQQQKVVQLLKEKELQIESELHAIRTQTQELKTTLTKQHAHLQTLQESNNQFILISTKLEEQKKQHELLQQNLHAQKEKVQLNQKELITLQAQMEKIENDLINASKTLQDQLQNPDLLLLQESLRSIEQQAQKINYQASMHQQLETELGKIRQILTLYAIQPKKTEQLIQMAQLQKNLQVEQTQLIAVQKKLLEFKELSLQHEELIKTEEILKQASANLDNCHQKLLIEKGSLETKQKKQADLQKERTTLTVSIKTIHEEMSDYQEIAKALGKDGIQALLIEQAIPEIEHETNQILARLTNNQTQVFIESLKDLKKGGSKETLDIKISDSFGLRDYEMFSGGEAFRIDFALRIGISKLLARRAGTTLQTIFIDEGFGSQDEEGLQLIMDNIYKIQDDFAKIIIVSHLPEMKEHFPVQFVIEKKRCGSTVSVVHQG